MRDQETPKRDPESRVMRPAQGTARRQVGMRPEVPDHEILRSIGMGAYGEVWLARSVTGAYRAVKAVWREDFEDERSFVREFEGVLNYEPVARGIPGLVHILHVGRHEQPSPYYFYVMELADDAYTGIHIEPDEYVPRTLLRDRQQYGNRPMPLDFVVEVGSQLAHALVGLHHEDLAHRDIKPANVVFVNGRAKLADAGLVAHSSQRSFVGTEGYIPPEGPGSPRADVYALAKVLYELGTGKDRLDFPELPPEVPEGASHRRWLEFNNVICAAADPHITKDTIVSAQVLADRLDALRDGYAAGKRSRNKKATARMHGEATHSRLQFWLVCGLAAGLLLALGSHFLPESFQQRARMALAILAGDEQATARLTEATSAAQRAQATPRETLLPAEALRRIPSLWQNSTHWLPRTMADAVLNIGEPGGDGQTAQTSTPLAKEGQLFISSNPTGASIYTEDGHYLDETPFGPVLMEAGQRVTFILRKEGYADAKRSGIVPREGVLTLSGDLIPYCPPRSGKVWEDALGTRYEPDGKGTHKSVTAVTKQMFEHFLKDLPQGKEIPYDLVPNTDLIRTTQNGISAFTLWLTHECERMGTLGRDHSLIARPERIAGGAENGMLAYRLSTALVQKTPITIYSNPAGATVMLNGNLLGVTPMLEMRVPLAPYFLEVRMPGYTTVRRSGLTPKDLFLNLELQPNNSVIFGSEWINSLGMKFQPAGSSILAGATEVRLSDYRTYCRETGTPLPIPPAFAQNEHHPVVNVSRLEAEAFAAWLTKEERRKGYIEDTDEYRLPTDEEWSALAGLRNETGSTPYERHLNNSNAAAPEYPWGIKWPPARATGNFSDLSTLPHQTGNHVIAGYRDDFPYTSPVGSFPPNALGLHDVDGNVSEWVSDEYGGPPDFTYRHYGVTRGGDFTCFRPAQLYSATRSPHAPTDHQPNIGFRLMLERYPRPR